MRAALNKTFTAKYDRVLPRTTEVRRKSEIYTPKPDDEHPNPFHVRSLPPLPPPPFLHPSGAPLGRKSRSALVVKLERFRSPAPLWGPNWGQG